MRDKHFLRTITKLPRLELKTQPFASHQAVPALWALFGLTTANVIDWLIHRDLGKIDCSRYTSWQKFHHKKQVLVAGTTKQPDLTALSALLCCFVTATGSCSSKWIFAVATNSANMTKQAISLFLLWCLWIDLICCLVVQGAKAIRAFCYIWQQHCFSSPM